MSRWKAAGIHVGICAIIALVAATLIFGIWYPQPYTRAAGADVLVLVLLGVDITIGPLLTLIVFRSGKPGLRFDLAVIAVLQACAFLYGMSVVVQARPAFVVANIDRFSLVAANDIDADDYARAKQPAFAAAPWTGPRLVGALPPTDIAERNALVLAGPGGKDIDAMPQYYTDYAAVAASLLTRAKPLEALEKSRPDAKRELADLLAARGVARNDVVWVPLQARRMALTMLLDRRSGTPITAVPIDPW